MNGVLVASHGVTYVKKMRHMNEQFSIAVSRNGIQHQTCYIILSTGLTLLESTVNDHPNDPFEFYKIELICSFEKEQKVQYLYSISISIICMLKVVWQSICFTIVIFSATLSSAPSETFYSK
jgi:hypothetical protein